jgi:hypothetical protein
MMVYAKRFIGITMNFLENIFVYLLLPLVLSGCARHYLYVESEVSVVDDIDTPKIVKTDDYRMVRESVKTVAIIAPDSCRNQSAMSSSTSRQDFIRSRCGVEIGIIEKELIANGFNVISWEILESIRDRSFLQSGKNLGIDVLFSVNSLENITADSSTIELKRSYYKSDSHGKKGEPWPLGEKHKKEIRRQLRVFEGVGNKQSFGAAIDVTAIDVKTGKSIWYYQAAFYSLENKKEKLTALFVGRKNRWRLFQVNGKSVGGILEHNHRSKSVEMESKVSRVRDDIFIKYLKIAVSSFVSAFKLGL